MTLDKYTIALLIIAILVTILIVAMAVSLIRRQREKKRPRWEDMYPDEDSADAARRQQQEAGTSLPQRRAQPSDELKSTPSQSPKRAPTPQPRKQPDARTEPQARKQPEAQAKSSGPKRIRDDSFRSELPESKQTPVAPRPAETFEDDQAESSEPTLLTDAQRVQKRKEEAPAEARQTAPAKETPTAPQSGALKQQDVEKLKIIVADESRQEESRLASLQRIVASGKREDQLHVLLTALNSEQLALRVRALEEISNRGDKELLDDVIPMVESENEDVAMSAVVALESIGGPIVEQALLAGLDSKHPAVRRKIIRSFTELDSNVVEEQLIEMAADDDPRRARIALQALGECGKHAALEALRSLMSMQTPDSKIRSDIEEAIRKIQLRVEGTSGTAEYPSFETEGGAGQQALDKPTGGEDEFSLTLDPDLFKQSGSQD
jgi:flagellar basal body-associated protein FliL